MKISKEKKSKSRTAKALNANKWNWFYLNLASSSPIAPKCKRSPCKVSKCGRAGRVLPPLAPLH